MTTKGKAGALVSFKNVGKNSRLADGILVDPSLIFTHKRADNSTIELQLTSRALAHPQQLDGAKILFGQTFGPFAAQGGLTLGPIKTLEARVASTIKFAQGKALELKAGWYELVDKNSKVTLDLTAKPHPAHKLHARLNDVTASPSAVVTYTAAFGGLTVAPAFNTANGARALLVSRPAGKGTATVGVDNNKQPQLTLKYEQKPYGMQVRLPWVRGPNGGGHFYWPTVAFGITREFDVGTAGTHVRTEAQHGVKNVSRIPLDTKLREIDMLYDEKMQQAKAKQAAK